MDDHARLGRFAALDRERRVLRRELDDLADLQSNRIDGGIRDRDQGLLPGIPEPRRRDPFEVIAGLDRVAGVGGCREFGRGSASAVVRPRSTRVRIDGAVRLGGVRRAGASHQFAAQPGGDPPGVRHVEFTVDAASILNGHLERWHRHDFAVDDPCDRSTHHRETRFTNLGHRVALEEEGDPRAPFVVLEGIRIRDSSVEAESTELVVTDEKESSFLARRVRTCSSHDAQHGASATNRAPARDRNPRGPLRATGARIDGAGEARSRRLGVDRGVFGRDGLEEVDP